jgi:transposase InsO family protein
VNRAFDPEQPDKLWVMDITEHPTSESKTMAHSDHGSVYTSWLFGNRLRALGIDGLDRRLLRQFRRRSVLLDPATRTPRPTPMASSRPARYRDLRLDRKKRRHSYNNGLSPLDYETAKAA